MPLNKQKIHAIVNQKLIESGEGVRFLSLIPEFIEKEILTEDDLGAELPNQIMEILHIIGWMKDVTIIKYGQSNDRIGKLKYFICMAGKLWHP